MPKIGYKRSPQQVLAVAAKRSRREIGEDCLGVVSQYVGTAGNVLAAITVQRERQWLMRWVGAVCDDFKESRKESREDQDLLWGHTLQVRRCYVPPISLDVQLKDAGEIGRLAWQKPIHVADIRTSWGHQLACAGVEWVFTDKVMDDRFIATSLHPIRDEFRTAMQEADRVPTADKVCIWLCTGILQEPLQYFAQGRIEAAQQRKHKYQMGCRVVEEYRALLGQKLPASLNAANDVTSCTLQSLTHLVLDDCGRPVVIFPGETLRLGTDPERNTRVLFHGIQWHPPPKSPMLFLWQVTVKYDSDTCGARLFKKLLREALDQPGMEDTTAGVSEETRYYTVTLSSTW